MRVLEINMIPWGMIEDTIAVALAWQSSAIDKVECVNSYGFMNLMSLAKDAGALTNLTELIGMCHDPSFNVPEVAMPAKKQPQQPTSQPPSKLTRGSSSTRDRSRSRSKAPWHSSSWGSKFGVSIGPGFFEQHGVKLEDHELELADAFQLDEQAIKHLRILKQELPQEADTFVTKLQAKLANNETLRNPSAFVITCVRNALHSK